MASRCQNLGPGDISDRTLHQFPVHDRSGGDRGRLFYNFNQHIGLIDFFDEQSGTGTTTLAVVKKIALATPGMLASTSASLHTMLGTFPPSSSDTAPRMSFPPSVSPVKPTLSTSRWAASAAPAVSTFLMVLLFDTSVRVWT